jgi:hypothetical protein
MTSSCIESVITCEELPDGLRAPKRHAWKSRFGLAENAGNHSPCLFRSGEDVRRGLVMLQAAVIVLRSSERHEP